MEYNKNHSKLVKIYRLGGGCTKSFTTDRINSDYESVFEAKFSRGHSHAEGEGNSALFWPVKVGVIRVSKDKIVQVFELDRLTDEIAHYNGLSVGSCPVTHDKEPGLNYKRSAGNLDDVQCNPCYVCGGSGHISGPKAEKNYDYLLGRRMSLYGLHTYRASNLFRDLAELHVYETLRKNHPGYDSPQANYLKQDILEEIEIRVKKGWIPKNWQEPYQKMIHMWTVQAEWLYAKEIAYQGKGGVPDADRMHVNGEYNKSFSEFGKSLNYQELNFA